MKYPNVFYIIILDYQSIKYNGNLCPLTRFKPLSENF